METPQRPDALVFIGAIGALADKEIFPAPPVGPHEVASLAAEVSG
jgi:hypothetical protein